MKVKNPKGLGAAQDSIVDAFQQLLKSSEADCLRALEALKLWYLAGQSTSEQKSQVHSSFANLLKSLQVLRQIKPQSEVSTLDQSYQKRDYRMVLEMLESRDLALLEPKQLELGADSAYACQEDDKVHLFCDRLLQRNPLHFRSLLLKGGAYYRAQDFESSSRCFQKILEIQPNNRIAKEYLLKMRRDASVQPQAMGQGFRRRWKRVSVRKPMVLDSYDHMFARQVTVQMLSPGGCLIEGDGLPEEFNFCLDLGHGGQVRGLAELIYQKGPTQWGVRFKDLNPRDEDLIQTAISC